MLVDVKYRPNLVPLEILVMLLLCFILRLLLKTNRDLDDGSRHACLTGHGDMDPRVARCMLECFQIAGLRYTTLADDQDTEFRLTRRTTPTDGTIILPTPRDHVSPSPHHCALA